MSNPNAAFPWANEKEVQLLFSIFADAGKEFRFVGGAVRDGLLKLSVLDLDAATTALPEEIISILTASSIRAIPTGLEHGTVTAVFSNRTIEITTLRLDTLCDGRHASVEYTENWEEDAARRDFTLNALYLDAQGTIHDYFAGLKDLDERRIRFIGDATARIEEDYLRVLRFFRFLATHGAAPADEVALLACKAAKDKLGNLSGERIQKEMLKLFGAETPVYALSCMQDSGVLEAVLGSTASLTLLPILINLEKETGIASHALLRLALILETDNAPLAARWRLSQADAKLLTLFLSSSSVLSDAPYLSIKRSIRRHGVDIASLLLLRDAARLSLAAIGVAEPLEIIRSWQPTAFPVNGEDLMAAGFKPGKELGAALKKLETLWEESNYTLSKEALLQAL